MNTRPGSALAVLAVALVALVTSALMDPLGTSAASPGEIASWTATSSLAEHRGEHRVVSHDGYIYAVGGYPIPPGGPAPRNTVERAEVQTDGTLGPWTVISTMPLSLQVPAVAASDTHLYVVGGVTDNTGHAQVHAAEFVSGGLGAWMPLTQLPQARHGAAAAIADGYIYVLGGHRGTADFNSVLSSPIAGDGTIGAWSTTAPMTTARHYVHSFISDGFIYALGGNCVAGFESGGGGACDSGADYFHKSVEYAPLLGGGVLGAWQRTAPMIGARSTGGFAVAEGHIYAVGGLRHPLVSPDTVESAPILVGGGLGTWQLTAATPSNLVGLQAAAVGCRVYAIGGFDISSSTVTVGDTYIGETDGCSDPPAPPTISYDIGGTIGNNGWYTSDVTLDWTVTGAAAGDGSLGNWANLGLMPDVSGYEEERAVRLGNHLYYIHGSGRQGEDNVSRAKILNADGDLGPWQPFHAPMPTRYLGPNNFGGFGVAGRDLPGTDGELWIVGGISGGIGEGETHHPPLRGLIDDRDGPISIMWEACGTSTIEPNGRSSNVAELNGDFLYVVGGFTGENGAFLHTGEYADISDGCPDATDWVALPNTTDWRVNAGSEVVDNRLFVGGGGRHGQTRNSVEMLTLNPTTGAPVGGWQTLDAFTSLHGERTAIAELNGFLYASASRKSGTAVEFVDVAGLAGGTEAWAPSTAFSMDRDHTTLIGVGRSLYSLAGSTHPNAVVKDVLRANQSGSSTTGCESQLIDYDTPGVEFTCSATSPGGMASETVEIKRDATDPVVTPPTDITVTTEDGPVDASHPAIVAFLADATATDVTSGVISEDNDAPGVFRVRATLVTFSAEDEAGNTSSASATVTVVYGCDGREATIVGGVWHDYIVGTDGPDVIVGRGGNDRIYGKGGNDTICGGSGQDRLHGGAGNDVLLAGDGWDKIYAGDGDDTLDGGAGQDYLSGHGGDDTITAGDGNDQVIGGPGADTIDGGDGHDKIRGDDGNDVIFGGEGWDRIDGGNGNDTIDAGAGHDSIRAGNGDDIVDGGPDLDHIYGGYGNDTLSGGDADDVIDAGPGDDAMDGGGGRDYCHGRAGTDTAVACEVAISVP